MKSLDVESHGFTVGRHWSPEVDLVLDNTEDRHPRLIECKWGKSQEVVGEALAKYKEIQAWRPDDPFYFITNANIKNKKIPNTICLRDLLKA